MAGAYFEFYQIDAFSGCPTCLIWNFNVDHTKLCSFCNKKRDTKHKTGKGQTLESSSEKWFSHLKKVKVQRARGSQFSFSINGPTGQVVRVESSTKLIDWTTISTLTNLTGIAQYSDPPASNINRFYRAVSP